MQQAHGGSRSQTAGQPVLWHLLLPTALPVSLLLAAHRVVVFNLGDRGKGYLYDLAVRAFYLYAWGGECLSGFHAPDNAPHALSVNSHDLDIVFAVQWLKGCECFCDFHVYLFFEVQTPLGHKLSYYSRDIAPEDGGCLSRVQYSQTLGNSVLP